VKSSGPFINKAIVPAKHKRSGNPRYGRVKALKVLVYDRLKYPTNDTRTVEQINKHPWIAKTHRLTAVPDRTTVGRWWRHYLTILEETFIKIDDMLQLAIPTKIADIDSTPLLDLIDMEAAWGHTNKGKFRGFKLHATVNQTGLPLRATVTPGNKFDKPFLPMLIDGLETDYVLADGAYRSKRNFQAISDRGAVPVVADNPR